MIPISADGWKAIVGMILFGTWVGLVCFQVQGADALIESIKMTLVGLASHYLTYYDSQAGSLSIPLTPPKQ